MAEKKLEQMLSGITAKKEQLDALRPLPKELLNNLNQWFKIELTYTSNAIEGNTLTSSETAIVVEKGLTIGGKTVKEHLEAINHAFAFDYILELARSSQDKISLNDVLDIHRLVLRYIDDENAGRLRKVMVRIAGSDVQLPDPVKVPELMNDFIAWLHSAKDHPVVIAADAHLKLVSIHPFVDGNGRTARLLMNLLLMQKGYPPALIVPQERNEYIDSLAHAQKTSDALPYYTVIMKALERSFEVYLPQARA